MKKSPRGSAVNGQRSIEVVGAVLWKNGQILIAQRAANDHGGGLWEFPGGKREPGESREAALVREIREELSLEIEVREVLGEQKFSSQGRNYLLIIYLCPIISGEPQLHEHQDFRWVKPQDLEAVGFSEPDVPLVPLVKKRLSSMTD